MTIQCHFPFRSITLLPMNRSSLRAVSIGAALIVLAVTAVIAYRWYTAGNSPEGATFDRTRPAWTWQNPVTLEQITIPPEWTRAKGQNVQGSVLTLTHWTGKCLLYLVHEQSADDVTLAEFVAARKKEIMDELGIDKVESVTGKNGYYQGVGAKLLGGVVADTQVRIWRGKPGNFWRAATITDSDYKNLEYEARNIFDLLMTTTL